MDRFERFTIAVFSITRYWNKIATEEMSEFGLKGSYALYLLALADAEEPVSAARLGEIIQRDKADVSRAVALLQEKGIVKPYGESRYRAPILLTEQGRSLAFQVRGKASAALEAAGQGLSEEMRQNMYLALDIIAGNMKDICSQD